MFIFVRNFSRGIFLRESLSKVAADLDSRLDTKWPISVMLSMDTWTVSHADFAAAATLDSDLRRKIPRTRARNHARNPTQPTAAKRTVIPVMKILFPLPPEYKFKNQHETGFVW